MKQQYVTYLLLIIAISVIFCNGGCRPTHHDERLTEISLTLSEHPEDALDSLKSIDKNRLSESDRHFHDFLTIKASDKAYIYHTSDSLILDVINFYSSHEKELYPEALYYGARVYSDLGDYPKSLSYFHQALDNLSSEPKSKPLKTAILSQMGRHYSELNLPEKAKEYIRDVIELERANDTPSTVYDLQLLGSIYNDERRTDSALLYLNEALRIGKDLTAEQQANTLLYLATSYSNVGQTDYAISLIKKVFESKNRVVINSALRDISKIYLKKGELDSAYTYADSLIHSADRAHKVSGYEVILSHELLKLVPNDSIVDYFNQYVSLLNKAYNQSETNKALLQEAYYDYRFYVKAAEEAEKSNRTLRNIICIGVFITCISLIVILIQKIRTKDKIIKLQHALETINCLKMELEEARSAFRDVEVVEVKEVEESMAVKNDPPHHERKLLPYSPQLRDLPVPPNPTIQDLRERLRSELASIVKSEDGKEQTPAVLLISPVYAKIKGMIDHKLLLQEDDNLWDEIEKTVLSFKPHFRMVLDSLSSGKINTDEYRTALLIKFGIKPTQIAALLGRTKSTIGSRRNAISIKMFGEKVGLKEIDALIRYL